MIDTIIMLRVSFKQRTIKCYLGNLYIPESTRFTCTVDYFSAAILLRSQIRNLGWPLAFKSGSRNSLQNQILRRNLVAPFRDLVYANHSSSETHFCSALCHLQCSMYVVFCFCAARRRPPLTAQPTAPSI